MPAVRTLFADPELILRHARAGADVAADRASACRRPIDGTANQADRRFEPKDFWTGTRPGFECDRIAVADVGAQAASVAPGRIETVGRRLDIEDERTRPAHPDAGVAGVASFRIEMRNDAQPKAGTRRGRGPAETQKPAPANVHGG